MADLDFGDSDEEAMAVIKGFAQRVNQDLYNHGRDGLLTRFNSFTVAFDARENERAKQHSSNRARLNLIIALLTLIAAYIAIIVTLRPWHSMGAFHTTLPPTYNATR